MDIFTNMSFWLAVIVLIIVVILFAFLRIKVKNKQAGQSDNEQVALLVEYLGGLDNIISVQATISKMSVKLIDPEKVNVSAIKGLGASGIVETKKRISIIFGDLSQEYANKINDMK